MIEAKLTITNDQGLHARPAAQFVQTAAGFKSKVLLTGNNKTVNGKSILSVLGLGLVRGTEITIAIDGEDEIDGLATLKALIEGNFGQR
ncbi:MAG: HPr family phosphocarrier protein [Negativicutes bacterium]|nr:HPr family phosphocarrier protein [Negativicutes bacterium]